MPPHRCTTVLSHRRTAKPLCRGAPLQHCRTTTPPLPHRCTAKSRVLRLGSCLDFGADYYFLLCRLHSADPAAHQPRPVGSLTSIAADTLPRPSGLPKLQLLDPPPLPSPPQPSTPFPLSQAQSTVAHDTLPAEVDVESIDVESLAGADASPACPSCQASPALGLQSAAMGMAGETVATREAGIPSGAPAEVFQRPTEESTEASMKSAEGSADASSGKRAAHSHSLGAQGAAAGAAAGAATVAAAAAGSFWLGSSGGSHAGGDVSSGAQEATGAGLQQAAASESLGARPTGRISFLYSVGSHYNAQHESRAAKLARFSGADDCLLLTADCR